VDTRDLIAGLTELSRYGCAKVFGDSDGVKTAPTDHPLTPGSVDKMRTLGWRQATQHYDRRESWLLNLKEAGNAVS
jgi:hypothetical protein